MSDPGCARLVGLQSAFVDGALSEADRTRMVSHLLSCDECRKEVEELRAVRRLLGRTDPQHTPTDLSQRLVSIAGDEAAEPLWTRPFQRTSGFNQDAWRLPRRRRRARMRATAAALAAGTALSAASLVGYSAAPLRDVAGVSDPDGEARAAFTSTLGQSPLAGQALAAVNLVDSADLDATRPITSAPAVATGAALDQAAALALMRRATTAAGSVSLRGHQVFTAYRDGRAIMADVDIEGLAGRGSELLVRNQVGERLLQHFSPATLSSRVVDDRLPQLLERNYVLTGRTGAEVAGRSATVVTAARGGHVSARWWIDDAAGVLLWHETYDEAGLTELSFGYTSIEFTGNTPQMLHYGPRLAMASTDVSLTLSSREQLAAMDWACPDQLAGLSLVRLRADQATAPDAIQADYSDGLTTVSVVQQRGRLAAPPDGMTWDAGLQSYVGHGASEAATWQSNGTVLTVVTDGSEGLLASAVSTLPHSGSRSPSTMDQIMAGWAKILADVKG